MGFKNNFIVIVWDFYSDLIGFNGIYPLVVKIAMENDHRNSDLVKMAVVHGIYPPV